MDIEERLARLEPEGPPEWLKRRVMTVAHQQAYLSVWDRIWSSRLFWAGAAAAVVAGLALSVVNSQPTPSPVLVAAAAEPSRFSQSLVEMLGDGPEIERWLAMRVDRARASGGGGLQIPAELTEELEWQS